jgi:hypothetical protein
LGFSERFGVEILAFDFDLEDFGVSASFGVAGVALSDEFCSRI